MDKMEEVPTVKQEPGHTLSQWENFPAGLRVLVVDDDPLCLKIIEQMLKRCNYEVCTCTTAASALEQLRDRTHNFDLVLSDVYMPDMDGFKLLEAVGLELDLPVIMMSANGEHTTVMRGVTHGACDFLIKPVRIEELRNIWQHVIRRSKHQAATLRETESEDLPGDMDVESSRKRKELCRDGSMNNERDDDANASKKPRVVWSVEMHQQFVQAVNQLGIDKAVPKKILELMKVDGLTRENVASHLQKYRLYLKRVQTVPTNGTPPDGHGSLIGQQRNSSKGTTGMMQAVKHAQQAAIQQQQPQQAGIMSPTTVMQPPQQQQQPLADQQQQQQQQPVGGPPPQQQQQPQQPQLGTASMPMDTSMGLLGSLMPQNSLNLAMNPMNSMNGLNPMASMMAGLNQNVMGMPGMPAACLPAMAGAAGTAAPMPSLPGLPGMSPMGPIGITPGALAPLGMPAGMPGLPGAIQGMGALGLSNLQAPGMAMPGNPGGLMNSMMANMQALFQAQQAAATATTSSAPSGSGNGSNGLSPQPSAAAAAAAAAMMPGIPGIPNMMQGAHPSALMAAMNPAAVMGATAAVPQQQLAQTKLAGTGSMSTGGASAGAIGSGSAGGASPSVNGIAASPSPATAAAPRVPAAANGLASPASAAAAVPNQPPDFSCMFDDVFNDAAMQPAAAPGLGAGNAAAAVGAAAGEGMEEFLDYFLKS